MEASNFTSDSPGLLIQAPQGHLAYQPNPLPPTLTPNWEIITQISAADRALSELSGVARTLPNPHLLIDPFVKREAVLSSRIEGTQAGLSDLLYFQASGETKTQDEQEVANYVSALNFGLKRLNEIPISLRLIRETHEILLRGTRGEDKRPGEFREKPVWINGPTIDQATYVPPPAGAILAGCLDAFERYLHSEAARVHPPLVRLAWIHYQFEAIHPFVDGNGRMGRLLMILLLCEWGLLPQPLLYLSAFFERNRSSYLSLLQAVTERGAWSEWVSFVLHGIAEQARDGIHRAQRLLDLQAEYRRLLQSARTSALLLRLVDRLFQTPAITVRQAEEELRITFRAASQNIDKLVDAGVLTEVTQRDRNRVFMAKAIVDIVEAESERAVLESR